MTELIKAGSIAEIDLLGLKNEMKNVIKLWNCVDNKLGSKLNLNMIISKIHMYKKVFNQNCKEIKKCSRTNFESEVCFVILNYFVSNFIIFK